MRLSPLSEAPCVIVNFLNFTFNKFSDYLPSPSHDESCKQIFCNAAKSLQKKLLHPFSLIESSLGCLAQRTVLVSDLAQTAIASVTAPPPHLPEFRSQPGPGRVTDWNYSVPAR